MPLRRAFLLGALLLSGPAVFSSQAQIPRGVFSLKGAGGNALPGALTNPDVVGLSVRQNWSDLEPSEGVFDFTYLDSQVQAAADHNKVVLLRINSQANKPAWVTQAVQDAGGTFFTFDDSGVPTTIPVFWDPTYLAKKMSMIAALGAHFGSNPTVKIVTASFANAKSEDWSVPHEEDEVTNWIAAGYTTEKLVDAGQQIIDATMVAFPNQYVALAIGGNGHSETRPNLDASATEVAATTISLSRSKWPGRLIVQINSLSTFNPVAPGLDDSAWNVLWNSQPDVGAQMLDAVHNDSTFRVNGGVPGDEATILTTAVDGGVSYGVNYIEVYELDVRNLQGAITYAREKLTSTPPAYEATGFVIGDLNAVVGQSVTFWGASWSKENSLSGGSASSSFKGFANSPSTDPPTCDGTWMSDPGNSSGPPSSVPELISVIVASSITKSGSTISGDITKIAIVQTDPGYQGDPGHPGTGTVTALICP